MSLATVAEMQRADRQAQTGEQGAEPDAGGFRGCPPEFKNTPGGWVASTAPRLSAEAKDPSA